MISVKEDTTLVGVSELRTKFDKVLKASRYSKVIIGRRNKPIAVLMDIDAYNKLDNMIEQFTDERLGRQAKERMAKSKPADFLDQEVFRKKFGLK